MTLVQEIYKLLYLLLLADIAFIAVDILFSESYTSLFAIVRDFGYAEVYQYIKEFWIAILLCALAVARRQIVYFAWTLLFLYFLFDDSLQIHEKFGRKVVDFLELKPVLDISSQTQGSLLVSVVAGTLLVSGITISYFFSNISAKQISKTLLVYVAGIVLFGVVLDTVHAALPGSIDFWSKIEDGGEMMAMSLVVAYVFSLNVQATSDHRVANGPST